MNDDEENSWSKRKFDDSDGDQSNENIIKINPQLVADQNELELFYYIMIFFEIYL
jgi:hypothetical protein